jgi:hypothetical protein
MCEQAGLRQAVEVDRLAHLRGAQRALRGVQGPQLLRDPAGGAVPGRDLHLRASQRALLPEEHRPKIFSSRNPHSSPTFLVDGRVAGTWRYENGRIRIDPFCRLDAAARRELKEEALRLAEFHA